MSNSLNESMTSINHARKQLYLAAAEENTEKILEWFRYYREHFSPLVYEFSELILQSMLETQHIKEILRFMYLNKPNVVLAILESNYQLKAEMLGKKIQVKNTQSDKITIYSDKLDEGYASSQECFGYIIESIAKKYHCHLMHDVNRPPSKYYQKLAQCVPISVSDETNVAKTKIILSQINARILIPITSNPRLELISDKSHLFKIHAGDSISGMRRPDYTLTSKIVESHVIPQSDIQRLKDIRCPTWAPEETSRRIYPKTKGEIPCPITNRMIRFGAFCRMSKLDLETLRTWSLVLNKYENSILYFSYLGTSKLTEQLTRAFFEEFGIMGKRIKFLPHLATSSYLEAMSNMDIIFGSSPEQGGISCADALMCNVPYIVYAGNSKTFAASILLKGVDKERWITRTPQEFIQTVGEQIEEINSGNVENTKEYCELLSLQLRKQYINCIFDGIDNILSDNNNAIKN